MHSLDKIKFTAFEASADIHGTVREVAFLPSEGEGYGPSMLSIKGISIDDAYQILARLSGGLLKGTEGENPPIAKRVDNTDTVKEPATSAKTSAPIDFAAKAKEAKEAKAKAAADAAAKATPTKPEPETEDDEADDVEGDTNDDLDADDAPQSVSIDAMSKFGKLRDLLEYFISKGYKTADQIVAVSKAHKITVPLLQQVEAKGDFDKRMERNALVVINGTK